MAKNQGNTDNTRYISKPLKKGNILLIKLDSNSSDKSNSSDNNGKKAGVFSIIIGILIVFAVVALVMGKENITFKALLQSLQDMPTVNLDWLNFTQATLGFPSWLSWLEGIIYFILNFVNVIGFLLAGAWQAVLFIIQILKLLFSQPQSAAALAALAGV